jgi:hypothetical protein
VPPAQCSIKAEKLQQTPYNSGNELKLLLG